VKKKKKNKNASREKRSVAGVWDRLIGSQPPDNNGLVGVVSYPKNPVWGKNWGGPSARGRNNTSPQTRVHWNLENDNGNKHKGTEKEHISAMLRGTKKYEKRERV